jgi:hypothetical protein
MGKHKRSRGLAQLQRERRQEWAAGLVTEIAALEGRLTAALNLDDVEALRAQVYGDKYLSPWERQDALLKFAAQVGV